jgi:hypothetical protein
MTFTRRLSNAAEEDYHHKRRETGGSSLKVKFEESDTEDSKFDLPNTPVEIE